MGDEASRADEIANSGVFFYLLSDDDPSAGLADLLVAIEHRKPIVMVATRGEPVPEAFREYEGPKLLLRKLNDSAGRRIRRFLVQHGYDPSQGPI